MAEDPRNMFLKKACQGENNLRGDSKILLVRVQNIGELTAAVPRWDDILCLFFCKDTSMLWESSPKKTEVPFSMWLRKCTKAPACHSWTSVANSAKNDQRVCRRQGAQLGQKDQCSGHSRVSPVSRWWKRFSKYAWRNLVSVRILATPNECAANGYLAGGGGLATCDGVCW